MGAATAAGQSRGAGGRQREPNSPWLRGAITVLLLLVTVTFFEVMGGDVDYYPVEHVWTPLVVLIDWIFVGRNQGRVRWWYPLTWLVLPLTYLCYFLAAGLYRGLYPFLNPNRSGFAVTILGFLIAVGHLLYGITRLKEVVAGRTGQAGPPTWGPGPFPQQGGHDPGPVYGPPAMPGPTPVQGPPPGYGPQQGPPRY